MQFFDTFRGLVNSLSGLGGIRDKGAAGSWYFTPLTQGELQNAYRSNWMCRKVVDIPAFDMLRAGWSWQAENTAIEKIEAEEKRLGLMTQLRRAIRMARLYGGAVIIIGDGSERPDEPLDAGKVKTGGVRFLNVVDRFHITSGPVERDPLSPFHLEPQYYDLSGASTGVARIHPSRVVRFIGADLPSLMDNASDQWGDSVLDAVEIAIRDATSGQQGIAALVQEAKLDVVKIDGMMNRITTKEYRDALQTRFALAMQLKSTVNALVLDKSDEYEQKTVNFGALPDVQRLQLQIVSGAADIPATRFLGQAPQGMNATGDSDIRNYYDRISAEQELSLRPAMQRLFDVVVRSALGDYPSDVFWSFAPLWQMSEKEKAEIGRMNAETAKLDVDMGLIPPPALATARVNQLVETGFYPGLEAAVEDAGDFVPADGPTAGDIPAETMPVADAQPRTLYVSRKVLNADDIIAWAKSQGFKTTLPADNLHVTIAFSREPVDWLTVGQPWGGKEDGSLTVPAGGARLMERFGAGAAVLVFGSSELSWRHEEIKRAGASWDWPEYNPHITISYAAEGVDLDQVEPYRGVIELGPEIFAEVKQDWQSGLQQK